MHVGQFLTVDVNIDTENMIMKLVDRNPIPVKRDKVWPFLGVNAECWYGVDTNNQGAGIIEGVYTDSGVAKPGPTRALARASAHLALASEINDDHMINLYSLQSMV